MRDHLSHYERRLSNDAEQSVNGLVQQVHILYRLLPATQWIDVAAVVLVFGLLLKYVDITSLLTWTVIATIIISVRISIQERYQAATVTEDNVAVWLNWFMAGTILYGTMWSMTAMLLAPSEIPTAAAFTGLILCGITAAGVAVSSVNLKAFTLYTVATLWPYSFFLLASGQGPQATVGGLMFLFSFVIFAMGLRTYHFFSNMVRLELRSNTLEQELRYESRKRHFAENALLDNTLEEELADKIRQQSLALKEGTIQRPSDDELLYIDQKIYLAMLNTKIRDQLKNVLVFVHDLENAPLAENLKKEVAIVSRILNNMIGIISKATATHEQVRQQIETIDFESQGLKPVNIRRLINYQVQALPLVYKAKFITINRHIDNNVPSTVYGDKESLERILSCLLNNAVKYSDGGNVDVSVRKVAEVNNHVDMEISVADTGIGMTRDTVGFLTSEKNDEQLERFPGLAVVKHLVHKHGSKLSVVSTPGVGTKITFRMQFAVEHLIAA